MKGGGNRDVLADDFCGLLGRRALPHAQHARGASADGGGQRNCRVDQNCALTKRWLELLKELGLSGKGNGEHDDVAHLHRDGVFHAFDASQHARLLGDLCRGSLRARGIARADDDLLTGARPAQRQSGTLRAGAADDGDHATSPAATAW